MNKQDFLEGLRRELGDLPQKDIDDSIGYYSEMIDDRIESGMSEDEAVSDIGTPETVASEIRIDLPLPTLIRSKCKINKTLKVWEIILIIIGSPIWLSLILAALSIVFSVYIVLWTAVISIWAIVASLFACSAGFVAIFTFSVTAAPMSAFLHLGAGIALMGIALLSTLGSIKLTSLFVKLSVIITKGIKRLIVGKENKE